MTYFVEHRRVVNRVGPLRYVPLEQSSELTGFRSVYAVDAATRDMILQAKTFRGMSGLPVFSDCLYIDFDGDEGVEEFQQVLFTEGIGYDKWATGRRGVHFHIPIEPMFGPHVPHSQLTWVEARATGPWDKTIYRPHSIIRLPGTWHEKNPGHKKELIKTYWGKRLVIPVVVPVPIEIRSAADGPKNEADFWSATLVPKSEPGRTARVYFLGSLARECGVDFETAREAVLTWASTQARPPLTNSQDVLRAFTSGYQG